MVPRVPACILLYDNKHLRVPSLQLVKSMNTFDSETIHRLFERAADDRAPVLTRASSHLQRVGGIGQREVGRMRVEMIDERDRCRVERFACPRRNGQQMVGPRRSRGRHGRRLFEDDVHVGAADAERADRGTARDTGCGKPRARRGGDDKRAGREIDRGVRRREVQQGRKAALAQARGPQ